MHTRQPRNKPAQSRFCLVSLEPRTLLSTAHPLTLNFVKTTHHHVAPPAPLIVPAGTLIPVDAPVDSSAGLSFTIGATVNLSASETLTINPNLLASINAAYSIPALNGYLNITTLTNPVGTTASRSATILLNNTPIMGTTPIIGSSVITLTPTPAGLTYVGANTTLGSTLSAGTLNLTVTRTPPSTGLTSIGANGTIIFNVGDTTLNLSGAGTVSGSQITTNIGNPFPATDPLILSNLTFVSDPSAGTINREIMVGFGNGTLTLINQTPSTDPTTIPPTVIDNANATLTIPDPSAL